MTIETSLIIITRNRAALLAHCLENICEQTHLPSEVIIIDNNSSDSTALIVKNYTEKLPIKYFLEKKVGRAAARNRGLEVSSKDIIFFTDDDCLPAKDWIHRHLEHHRNHPTLAIGGPLKIYDPEEKHTYSKTIQFFFDDYINKGIFLAISKQTNRFNLFRFFFDSKNHNKMNITNHLFTANISYKRDFFKRYGNYNSDLITGEEHALHNHAFKNGAHPFLFDPKIEVLHTTWTSLKETFIRYFEYGYFDIVSTDLKLLTLIKKSLFTFSNCIKLNLNRSKLLPKEILYVTLLSLAIYSGNNYGYFSKKFKAFY